MARKRCNSCGGEYDEIQTDGLRYFHACPPVAEYFDAAGAPIDRATYESIVKLGGTYRVRYVERPNARDENPIKSRDKEQRGKPKKLGAGVVDAPPAAPGAGPIGELVVVPPPKVL